MNLVSVITPTYDRAHTLPDTFRSLLDQRHVQEWIVSDDGSTDRTAELVEEFRTRAPFPIRYLWQQHAGKHLAVNRGVAVAEAPLTLLLDSDDTVLPGALDRLVAHWQALPDPADFVGVTGFTVTADGRVIGKAFPADTVDATWQEMVYRDHVVGDKKGIMRTDVLKAHPYRSVGGYVYEGEVYRQIGYRYRTRCVNLPVLAKRTAGADRLTARPFADIVPGAISFHSAVLNEDIDWLPHRPREFVVSAGLLARGLLHQGIPVHRHTDRLANRRAKLLWAACLPLGWALYRQDLRRRPQADRVPARGLAS